MPNVTSVALAVEQIFIGFVVGQDTIGPNYLFMDVTNSLIIFLLNVINVIATKM